MQKFVFPWRRHMWSELRQKFTQKINSVVDLDTLMSSHLQVQPQKITQQFKKYFGANLPDGLDERYFLETVLPFMQRLIKNGNKYFKDIAIPLLSTDTNIVLTRRQAAVLMACLFFGLLKYNYVQKPESNNKDSPAVIIRDFPEFSIMDIMECDNVFALACLLEYFSRIEQYDREGKKEYMNGIIIMKRDTAPIPNWENSNIPITDANIGAGPLDASPVALHLISSREFIGEKMFKRAPMQELTAIMTRPESLLVMIFCPELRDSVCVVMGCERLCEYTGMGASIQFAGKCEDTTPIGELNGEMLYKNALIFANACTSPTTAAQFSNDFFGDLNKCYRAMAALKFDTPVKIACPHWSYPGYSANLYVKFIQLLIASTMAQKIMVYYAPAGDFESKVETFALWCIENEITTGQLITAYWQVMKRNRQRLSELDIFEEIMSKY